MSASILRIWSLWLVKEHALLKDGLDLFSLSIPGCSAGWRNWRSNVGGAFVKWEDGIIQAFKRGKENSVDFWQNTSNTNIGWSPYVKRSREKQTVSDWMKLADFTSDSGIDRPVYMRICTHLPSQPLASFFVDYFSIFLENWWWSFVERDPTWTWWQRANGGLSWRRDRPQSARRHLRSCCSWSVKDRMSSAETEVHNLSQDTVWCGERWVTRHSSSATLPASTLNSSSSSSLLWSSPSSPSSKSGKSQVKKELVEILWDLINFKAGHILSFKDRQEVGQSTSRRWLWTSISSIHGSLVSA